MKRVLFITSTRIGDAVLSMGLIDHIVRAYPDALLTIVCGGLPSSLLQGVPNLEKLIVLKKKPWKRHWFELWKQVVGTRWDMVVDLRNSFVSRLIWSERRYIHGGHIDGKVHKAEQNARVMKLDYVPSPRLWITPEQAERAKDLVPDGGPVLGVGPTANWIGKTWPADRFIEVIRNLTGEDGLFPRVRVAVFAAPGEEKAAYEVLESVPLERRIDVIAKGDPGVAAAALARCAFYIGNDSGLMHCAAAAGVPTVGLFGASYANVYAPWGAHTSFARTPETFDELTDFPGYNPKTLDRSLMVSLSVETVMETVRDFLRSRMN
jgi:lipopolysaccharide export system permease protein